MSTVLPAKDPDVARTYTIGLRPLFVLEAKRSWGFQLGEFAKPHRFEGFYLECTKAGETSSSYPRSYPRRANETIVDGSLEWTSRHPDDAALPDIQSLVWSLPAALTLDSQSEAGDLATVTISGGLNGLDYEVTARVTPTAGDTEDVTFTVPVRQQ